MLAALIPILGPIFNTIIDRAIPDKNAAAKAKVELETKLLEAATAANQAQLDINKEEAGHRSIFVAGWRPGIGWVCAAALAYQFVLAPLGLWVAGIAGETIPPPPALDDMLWELLAGMLGLAGLRTFEKSRGLTK